MSGPLRVTNEPSLTLIILQKSAVLFVALLVCFGIALFAADPVNKFFGRRNHNEMVWTLFAIGGVIAAVAVASRSSRSAPPQVIEMDGAGFVSQQGEQRQRVSWIDVIDTHYDEVTRKGGGPAGGPDRQLFRIYLRDGSGLLLRGFERDALDTIISKFNESTKHLPFLWYKKDSPEPAGRDTLTGHVIRVEDRGDALRRRPARLIVRIDSALYGKPSDYPNPMSAIWEFWWHNAAHLPAVGEKVNLCGYYSQSTDMFFAGGTGYCRRYEKRLRSDA